MSSEKPSNYVNTTAMDITYTAIQFLLFMLFIAFPSFYRFELPQSVWIIGIIVAALGFILFFTGVITLRKSLSLYPTPTQRAPLITHGVYKYLRHPIYAGLLVFFLGISLMIGGLSKFIILIALGILFYKKAIYEEERLKEKYPEYEVYQKNTGMFFPRKA